MIDGILEIGSNGIEILGLLIPANIVEKYFAFCGVLIVVIIIPFMYFMITHLDIITSGDDFQAVWQKIFFGIGMCALIAVLMPLIFLGVSVFLIMIVHSIFNMIGVLLS